MLSVAQILRHRMKNDKRIRLKGRGRISRDEIVGIFPAFAGRTVEIMRKLGKDSNSADRDSHRKSCKWEAEMSPTRSIYIICRSNTSALLSDWEYITRRLSNCFTKQ
jgi:hypothetical protein